jgi:RNA polymerase sigma-70 factor (ECF subfamily)
VNWTELLEQHAEKLFLYARQWSCEAHGAEDLVQEGFVRFWRANSRKTLSEAETLAYLFTAVRRVALDRLRSDRRRKQREGQVADLFNPVAPMFTQNLEQKEDTQQIEKALTQLPLEQREVLVLKIWGGEMTFQMIADTTGDSLGTVTSRYRHALESLRKQLPNEWSTT